MDLLEGFKLINIAAGSPMVSITKNGVSFSRSAIAKINYPPYVHVMLDEVGARMAIIPSALDDDAMPFAKDKKSRYVRWNNRDFTKRLLNLVSLDLNSPDFKGIRVESEYYPNENALIFNLKDYKVIDSDSTEDN